MPRYTDEQIRNRLVYVDPEQLSGKTPHRLQQIERITGLPSETIIDYYARNGYTWADVAEFVDVNRNTLMVFCHSMGWKFPWQGVKSDRSRYRQSQLMKGRKPTCGGPKPVLFQAFGIRAPLRELTERFSPVDVSSDLVRMRLIRGYPLEEALTTPTGQPRGQKSPRYGKAKAA